MIFSPWALASEPDTFGAQQTLATLDSLAKTDLGDTANGYVADQYTYDDNLFRLPNDVTNLPTLIGPNASREDRLNTTSIGGFGQWLYSGQAVAAQIRADDNRYSRNDDLDNVSGNAKGVWDWRVGSTWLGELGADFSRSLAGASNSKFFARDLIDQTEYFGTALVAIGAHWNLIGGVRYADITNSATARAFGDFHSRTENFGLEYVTFSDDTVAIEYRRTEAHFPQTIILDELLFDQSYTEDSGRLLVKYVLTPQILIDGSVGYLKRNYPDPLGLGSFSGNVWRVVSTWQPLPKTQFVFSGWRQLASYLDSESDYFVSNGGSFAPTWTPREKLSLALAFSYDKEDYISYFTTAFSGAGPSGPRADKIESQQAIFTYSPRDALVFKLTYGIEHRVSNKDEFRYDDKLASTSLTFKF
jgi:hypothetical protein